jgi:phosphoribosylformimino-5-aminoimidazole carboxamide ribotide isomerase
MPILPVLDILDGQVVRGIAGRRSEYRPIVSGLCPSAWPRDVARALAEHFAIREFYVADLDAIGGSPPAQATYEQLHADGYRLWIDAGIRTVAHAARMAALGVQRIVVGLETVEGPACVAAICRSLGSDRVVFSLDLNGGEPLGNLQAWHAATADAIVAQAMAAGITRLLVLDLAHVGMGGGTGTESLCAWLHQAYPALSLAAGGGVRDASDVSRLYRCGVRHVLVASALHDGRLSRADVTALQLEPPS